MPADRPNVLFIVDDEHRPDVLGFAGNDVVRTPNLDSLAETGVTFENAYTPSPVCVPARHSIRTGMLPQTWLELGFEAFEADEHRTFAHHLGEHGYVTASAGKEHYPGRNQLQGWRKRLSPTPLKQPGIKPHAMAVKDEAAVEGQAGLGEFKWSWSEEITRAGVADPRTVVQDRRAVESTEQYLREFFASPYYDRNMANTSTGVDDAPLLLKTSFMQPHYPFGADEDLFTYYLNRVEPFVESADGTHPVTEAGEPHPMLRRDWFRVEPGEDVTERHVRRATAAYYAMVERVDDHVGQVLESLEHLGEDPDEWVIVFTSDHGEMLGERGVWAKQAFYEESVGVPLLIRWPERFDPGTVEANVSLCDLYATFCDIAGVPVPEGRDSRSLVPLLEGDAETWHERHADEAVSQFVSNSAVVDGSDQSELMIKRGDLKYCYYGADHEEVLFDLDADPGETTNHADHPDYESAMASFRERRDELGYGPEGLH